MKQIFIALILFLIGAVSAISAYAIHLSHPAISADVAVRNLNGGEAEAVAVRHVDKFMYKLGFPLTIIGAGCIVGSFFLIINLKGKTE